MDPVTLQALKDLADQISQSMQRRTGLGTGGSSLDGSRKSAADIRTEKATKDVASAFAEFNRLYAKQRKTLTDLHQTIRLNNSLFDSAIKSTDTVSGLDKLAKTFKTTLEKSNSEFVKRIGGKLDNSLESVIKAQSALDTRVQFAELWEKTDKPRKNKQKVIDAAVDQFGISIKEATQLYNKANKSFSGLKKDTADLAKAMADASDVVIKHNKGLGDRLLDGTKRFGFLGYATARVTEEFYIAAKAAARYGTELNTRTAILMGLSPEELSELQAKHKQAIMATSQSYSKFNEAIKTNYIEMVAFTGGLKESVQLNASLVTLQRNLGDTTGKMTGFLTSQQDRFKNWNRVFSITAEQFSEMNNQLLQSQTIRTQLFKLNMNQRRAYFEETQQTYERLRVNGLMHEQALRVIDAFASIGAESPRERMKKAARLQAVMGGLGMGTEGQEAAKLMRRGLRGEGDQERFAELMKQAQMKVSEQMAGSIGQEMTMYAQISRAGLEKFLGPDSPYANMELQRGQELEKNTFGIADLTDKMKELASKIGGLDSLWAPFIAAGDMITSLMSGPLFAALGAVAGGLFAFRKGIGSFLTKLTNIPSMFKNILSKIPGLGSMFSGSVGTAASVGSRAAMGATMAGGAGSLLAYSAYQLAQAATTGKSDVSTLVQETFPTFYNNLGKSLATIVDGVNTGWESFADLFSKPEEEQTKREEWRKTQETMEKSLDIQQRLLESSKQVATSTNTAAIIAGKTEQAIKEGTAQQIGALEGVTELGGQSLRMFELRSSGRRPTQ